MSLKDKVQFLKKRGDLPKGKATYFDNLFILQRIRDKVKGEKIIINTYTHKTTVEDKVKLNHNFI